MGDRQARAGEEGLRGLLDIGWRDRLQGGEVLNDQDVAPKTMGIIVVVSPLWFNDSRTIAAAQIWPSQLLAWVRTKVLTISNASFWYSGDSDRKYLRI